MLDIRKDILNELVKGPRSLRILMKRIKLQEQDQKFLEDELNKLIYEGVVIQESSHEYVLIKKTPYHLARVTRKTISGAFLTLVNKEIEVHINSDESKYLLVNDLVYVTNIGYNNCHYAGDLKLTENLSGNFLIIDSEKTVKLLSGDSFRYRVELLNECSAKPNDLVKCKIIERDYDNFHNELVLKCNFEKILVSNDTVGADITKILVSKDVPIEFPEEVIEEVKKIPSEVLSKEKEGRKDYRNTVVVTIDGDDALDFDDAISVTMNENGSYNLTVHIADVSHYVKPNTALDSEAYLRGNSIYVADRVVPMLPKELSNGICSLNPHVDRLTMSVEMLIDPSGRVCLTNAYKGLINSHARLTYTQVNEFIKSGCTTEIYDEQVTEMLKNAYELHKILRNRRDRNGALKLESDELKFHLDEQGNPVRVDLKVQDEAEKLIEDFMITCNCEVCKLLERNDIVTVFRVHDEPPEEKLSQLKLFLSKINLSSKFPNNVNGYSLNKFLESITDTEQRKLVSSFVLRSMAKACYSTENTGHFGLNEDDYLHFTSPIRRYPDLCVHRSLVNHILKHDDLTYREIQILEEVSQHTSITERLAQKCEYAVDDLLTCKYFRNRIGYKYHAIISGLSEFGMYVKTDIGLEGFLPFKFMNKSEEYTFSTRHFDVLAKRSNIRYNYGDKIDIVVLSVDMQRQSVDFCLPDYFEGVKTALKDKEFDRLMKNDRQVIENNDYFNKSYQKMIEDSKYSKKKGSSSKKKNNFNKKEDSKQPSKHKSAYKKARSFSRNKENRKLSNKKNRRK